MKVGAVNNYIRNQDVFPPELPAQLKVPIADLLEQYEFSAGENKLYVSVIGWQHVSEELPVQWFAKRWD